jgi:hypothetical protein
MSPYMRSDVLFGAIVALLVGCGDGLVDGDYRGEPLLKIQGSVITDSSPEELDWPDGELRISLHWAQWSGESGFGSYDSDDLETITSFPARYELNVYQPPPQEARFSPHWAGDREIAVGTPLLYVDRNDNFLWDSEDEPMVGGSYDVVAVYLDDGQFDEDGDTGSVSDGFVTLRPGYQKMYANVDYCSGEAEADTEFFPVEDEPVHLYVGLVWEDLVDWTCGT